MSAHAAPSTQIVLPAHVFDTLKASAEKFGGIGAGMCFDYGVPDEPPRCIIGHALKLAIEVEVLDAGLDARVNDSVVGETERVSWDEYCRRAHIVRGD